MSRSAFEAEVKAIKAFIDKSNAFNRAGSKSYGLDYKNAYYYLHVENLGRYIADHYGLPLDIAAGIIIKLQNKAKRYANPNKGIIWGAKSQTLVFKNTKRSNYDAIARNFNAEMNRLIKAALNNPENFDEMQVGHLQQANVADAIYGKVNRTSLQSFKISGKAKGAREYNKQITALYEDEGGARQAFDTKLSSGMSLRELFKEATEEIMKEYRTYAANVIKEHMDMNLYAQRYKVVKETGSIKGSGFLVQYTSMPRSLNTGPLLEFEKEFKDFVLDYVQTRLYEMEGSTSIKQDIDDLMVSKFYQDGSYKTRKSKNSKSLKVERKNEDFTIPNKFIALNKIPKEPPIRNRKGQFTSVISIMSIINSMLHDRIKSNMGKGAATQKLNYRTGRFAHSAKVENIAQSGSNLLIDYSYMNNPYDVFSPGGKLYKPGRDPQKLINMSIRQIASSIISKKFNITARAL